MDSLRLVPLMPAMALVAVTAVGDAHVGPVGHDLLFSGKRDDQIGVFRAVGKRIVVEFQLRVFLRHPSVMRLILCIPSPVSCRFGGIRICALRRNDRIRSRFCQAGRFGVGSGPKNACLFGLTLYILRLCAGIWKWDGLTGGSLRWQPGVTFAVRGRWLGITSATQRIGRSAGSIPI